MAQEISIGVKSIKCGPIPDDGTMGTVLTSLGLTYKDSASFKEDKPSTFEVSVEESDDPVDIFLTKGKKNLAFSLIDYTPETIQAVKGGSVVNSTWLEPLTLPRLEKSVQVISQTDILFEFPRINLSAAFNAELKKAGVALLDVTGAILKPNGLSVPAVKISKYQLPVVSAGVDQTITVDHATVTATATAFRGIIVGKVWTVVSKPVGAADPTFTAAGALSTTINGLVTGVYVLKFAATDENEYTGADTVQISATVS